MTTNIRRRGRHARPYSARGTIGRGAVALGTIAAFTATGGLWGGVQHGYPVAGAVTLAGLVPGGTHERGGREALPLAASPEQVRAAYLTQIANGGMF